mgnify:CR=1 FL=1
MSVDGSIAPDRVHSFFSHIAKRYDLVNRLLSLGIDRSWRHLTAKRVASRNPTHILDLATGSGDLALAIQSALPNASVTGADFCEPMLEQARQKGLKNTVVADALQLPFPNHSFDTVTVAFGLRNMRSWPDALREMHRVLRPNGHLLILDFGLPSPPLLTPYRFYLHHILPQIAGLLTGDRDAYTYLAHSIDAFPRDHAMCEYLSQNHFHHPRCTRLADGIAMLYEALTPPHTP